MLFVELRAVPTQLQIRLHSLQAMPDSQERGVEQTDKREREGRVGTIKDSVAKENIAWRQEVFVCNNATEIQLKE